MGKRKKILVLPGTRWQLAVVKKMKEEGHCVLLVDPSEDAPCIKYADMYLKSDIFDLDKIYEFIDQNTVDAVLSDQCDIAMPVIAQIGNRYHLSALDPKMACLYTNKYQMRKFCRKVGIKYPQYKLCKTEEDVVVFFRELRGSIIVKPLDCNSSKGVFKIGKEEEIRKYFNDVLKFSRVGKSILAERYIEGTEFTVDGVKTPTAHYTLAISEKKHFEHNMNIASELLFSHFNDRFDYELLKRINDKFVMESDLQFGFTHAEYKCEDGDFYLIEIAARGGGNEISSIITQYMSGYDTYEYLIKCSLGEISDREFLIQEKYRKRVAVLKFFNVPRGGGKVKSIKGLNYLETESGIADYVLNFNVGDTIADCISDSARIGFYIACAESMDRLKEVMRNVDEKFEIELWK